MKRLIIHLKKVEKVTDKKGKKKIFNTLNIPIKDDKEIVHHLSMHSENIKSQKISYCK